MRDQNPSLGMICPGDPHHRNPNGPKFEDRSQEETEWQERCAREAVWRLAKSILKIKGKIKQHSSHLRKIGACLHHQILNLRKEIVVDSGASMHMISKKDLSDAEMDTLTKSCSPTTVITANGEVQTHEEAIVYVKELDIFLTMKVLENTPAVLSLVQLCDENGYSYEWINGRKPHLIKKKGIRIRCIKSAVPLLKKGDWHERGPVTDQCHDRPGKPDKRSDKKLGQKSSKRQSSDARQLGCVFQDMTPPKSILRKCTDMPKPIQRVKFTKAIARHTQIRDQNPSLGYICPFEPHEHSPNAPKIEDRSQEETEWQEQGAREAAWKLAKSVLKLKEHQGATFFSLSENRCLPASTLKPEQREFVVDSVASMHIKRT